MSITSDIDVCNMTLNLIGNSSTVANIISPTDPKETTFAIWFDVARQFLLRAYAPNFAKDRRRFIQIAGGEKDGYAYAYQIPNDCLLVLGIGDLVDKRTITP